MENEKVKLVDFAVTARKYKTTLTKKFINRPLWVKPVPGEIRSILPGNAELYRNDRFVCGRSRTAGESRRFVTRSRVDENAKSHIVSGCRSCNRIKCYSRRTFGEGGLDVDNKNRIGIVTKYRKESVADTSVTLSLF